MTMREILFRGKHMAGGDWCYGNLAVRKDGVSIITPDATPIGVYGQVDPDTVGQYTGVNDKNGVYIYEGDIVRFSLITGRSLVYQGLRKVTFNCGSFMIEDPYSGDDESISRISEIELEIVGNVYDNPDKIADYIQLVRKELMGASDDEQ